MVHTSSAEYLQKLKQKYENLFQMVNFLIRTEENKL